MKKTMKKILFVVAAFILSIVNVNAATDTIQIGQATKVKENYIAGVTFSYKVTTDGRPLYCLDLHRNTATNITANIVKNSSMVDGGLVYILANGYPNKSITGDSDKDYYITQTAVWWYLDSTKGAGNLGNGFKSTGSDPYNLRQYVKKLVDDGIAHKNDKMGYTDTKLALTAIGGDTLTLSNNYYVSNSIKATTVQNVSSYKVTLENAPKGTIIVASNNTEKAYTGEFTVSATDSFKVKVPASSVTGTEVTFKVKATATGNTQYMAYEYQPTNSAMQNVALLEKQTKSVSTEIKLDIVSSKVTIIKLDASTKKPLAGAKLVLKNEAGKTITSWTSTINGHVIRNLSNGTYILEELEAPKGYLLSKKQVKFTVNDKNRDIKVTMDNTPKHVVVNITKIDQETNLPLAGAVLLVKNSKGKEIARFTTTENSYVLTDIENGTYTVEEVSAPAGYIKSNAVLSFTVDDNHLSHQVIFKNAKEVPVPDTGTNASNILFILGIVITSIGMFYIYTNAKRA